ncbi:hypothetical protein BRC81_16510 [Halobacteriales archaeon QS_1_68_20]|nr:MAG: hypothetical protein BRC81_16510 [Halobacteriales archaeon QS_1_68_20]
MNVGNVVEYGDREGVVQAIGFRTTRVRTLDNDTVIVPNAELTVNPVVNRTINDPVGITVELGIADDDIGQAMRIVRTVAREHADLSAERDPQVRVVELRGDDVVLRAGGGSPKRTANGGRRSGRRSSGARRTACRRPASRSGPSRTSTWTANSRSGTLPGPSDPPETDAFDLRPPNVQTG